MPGDRFSSNLFILTGAPGTGKTVILRQLGNEFRCVDEPAREILAEQRATGGSGTWDEDASLFVQLLLQRSIETYAMARRSGETVIFDRGIPDCIVYALLAGTDPTPSLEAADAYRYQPRCSSSNRGVTSTRPTKSGSCPSTTRCRSTGR